MPNFDLPVMACIRPVDRTTTGKFVFHRHDGSTSFSALQQVSGPSSYVCGSTSQFSLFVLGETQIPDTGFAPGVVTDLSIVEFQPLSSMDNLWLEIPSLGLELPIVGVPLTEQGWDVTWLDDGAGYLEGTAFPTWDGNTAVTAHVWDADNNPGPFIDLHTLRHGDQIIIHAFGQQYIYEVRESLQGDPQDMGVLESSEYDVLTLLTCESWSPEAETYLYRRAVKAVLVDVDSK